MKFESCCGRRIGLHDLDPRLFPLSFKSEQFAPVFTDASEVVFVACHNPSPQIPDSLSKLALNVAAICQISIDIFGVKLCIGVPKLFSNMLHLP